MRAAGLDVSETGSAYGEGSALRPSWWPFIVTQCQGSEVCACKDLRESTDRLGVGGLR